jgi:flavodoxin
MNKLIIYDSVFGNTEHIAQAIGNALGAEGDVGTYQVNGVKPEQLRGLNLLIVGSPTRSFKPTEAMTRFLKNIPKNGLKGVKVAAFDTRLSISDIESAGLRFVVKTGGYAAKLIANRLQKCGGELIMPPEGFLVRDVEGPLKESELERAADWARKIKEMANPGCELLDP